MNYSYGLKRGIPIALGYLSVSFGFGIFASGSGLMPLEAILISMTNLTSAGQKAGVDVIATGGTLIEMIVTQLVINLRYSLMGISLTQKLNGKFTLWKRLLLSMGITDEIFAVASSEKENISPVYMLGLMTLPYVGWTMGTALGAFAGNVLPAALTEALGLALYSMFIAIIVPPAKKDKGILLACVIAAVLSCILFYIPIISQGFAIILCAVIAAALMAILHPVKHGEGGDAT
ncbi:MAG: AzlC family ABC transporter permease [Clostridia bacterium]|nr:AzlC family ABC transporter permease [Clostridia bacterium]